MDKSSSILVVTGHTTADAPLLAKSLRLAQSFATNLELYLCDAEHAYSLQHAYEQVGVESVKKSCIAEAIGYLARLKASAVGTDVSISIDAACESPLCEGIVRKVRQSAPQLVIKTAGGSDSADRTVLDFNDWHLMRACPATLMLTRGRRWRPNPRIAAAVDMSEQETAGLASRILQNTAALARATGAELELLYVERENTGCAGARARSIALERLATEAGLHSGQIHSLAGDPEHVLPLFASGRDYDVLVLGALTHRTALAPLVGTLTSRLVDMLDCDFVLVKADAARLPELTSRTSTT